MNAYESSAQKVIPAVLLYAFYEGRILMLHARAKDGLPGKWNGLGGKLDAGESMKEACQREFQEEAFCETTVEQWRWLGQLYFPNFKSRKSEDWWVNVFVTDLTAAQASGIPLNDGRTPEGELQFLSPDKILELDLWEGDRHFLPYVFQRVPFEGTFFYENGKCIRHEISAIMASEATRSNSRSP
jgi:8-oxo-dGTP diphosphatase